jgi:outer membrane biosynthesis protein TonB
MLYLRRLLLLLTLSTSILLVTIHLLHFSRSRHQEPLHPVVTKEQAEEDFNYLKEYDHSKQQEDKSVPNSGNTAKIALGKEPAKPPKKEEVQVPPEQKKPKPGPKPGPKPDLSKVAPANATAWHKDRNMWKVGDTL